MAERDDRVQRTNQRRPASGHRSRPSDQARATRGDQSGTRRPAGAAVPSTGMRRGQGGGRAEADRPEGSALSMGKGAILVLVILMLVLTLAVPVRTFFTQRAEKAQLLAEHDELTRRVQELEATKERYSDPAYLEEQARRRLVLVKPGETPFTIVLPEDRAENSQGDSDGSRTLSGPGPWYTDLWRTLSEPQVSPEQLPEEPDPSTTTEGPDPSAPEPSPAVPAPEAPPTTQGAGE